jgi:hypothetical protein
VAVACFDRSSYVKHVRSFSVSVIGLRVSVIGEIG